jgi:hypothetical protein
VGFEKDPIIPEPNWGNPNPNIDPAEWEDEDEEED